jgi:hypothetical protein
MRLLQPHGPGGRPCLPTHHPRSQPPWLTSPTPTRSHSRTLTPRTCWLPCRRPRPASCPCRHHPLVAILSLAATAVLAGAQSIAAIAEWAAEAPQPVRVALGARRDAPDHLAVPAEAAIRRTLTRLDLVLRSLNAVGEDASSVAR